MNWVLVFILFNGDGTGTYESWPYPDRFATEEQCHRAGIIMADGDGDNEHFVCADVNSDTAEGLMDDVRPEKWRTFEGPSACEVSNRGCGGG
jgi:hypothetical protein